MTNLFKNKKEKGFTLVETLIALSIFTVSVLALMSVLGNGLSNINTAKRKTTATFLAQEGVEYIRNIRDTYVLFGGAQEGWTKFNENVVSACLNNYCYYTDFGLSYTSSELPITNTIFLTCNNNICPNMKYDSSKAKYDSVEGSEDTIYIRKIKFEMNNNNPDEVKVISTVSWDASGSQEVILSGNLFNWTER